MADSELREALNAAQVTPAELRGALDLNRGNSAESMVTLLDLAAVDEHDPKIRAALTRAVAAMRDVPREVLTDVIAKVILGVFGVR